MLIDRIENRWIEVFTQVFELCRIARGDIVAILSETQSRPVNVQLTELALARLGARAFHVVLPTPAQSAPVPVRSTGASNAVAGIEPVITALAATTMVVDLTVEGMLHAPELPGILAGGARLLMISNEHPEALERLAPDPALEARVRAGISRLRKARAMEVRSDAGTELTIDVSDTPVGGGWGYCDRPGRVAHWPGGLVLCFPGKNSVNGTLVLDRGDVNLTFKRYLESPVRLRIENDHITEIAGEGLDAELFRQYIAAWDDPAAHAVSHVGWGMNPRARWESMAMYDKNDFNGTELRAFAGNFLYSTGSNEHAGRYTLGHFDLPMRTCTITLDGEVVVDRGALQGELA